MKAFLSSTYVDLVGHRQAAAEAIERLGQHVGRMELFGAGPAEPSQACLTEIDDCDLFVGLYAHRYGHVPDGSHVSITESEFDHAQKRHKPMFCFLVDEDHAWPPKMTEDEPGKSRLRSFKNRIGTEVVRDTFTTPQDLAYKIAASLGRYLSTVKYVHARSRTTLEVPQSHMEFFDRILSEIANLRLELNGQKELLQKVNRIGALLQSTDQNAQAILPIHETLPAELEGCWRDSESGSTLYARFLGEDLVVPYSFGDSSKLAGVFFDFRKRSERVLFARFKWIHHPIQGFAYVELTGSDTASGGWWYAQDVPEHVLLDLERFGPKLPRMNDLSLSKLPRQNELPRWVDDFFSKPQTHY